MSTGSKITNFAHRTLVVSLFGLAIWSGYGSIVLLNERLERKRQRQQLATAQLGGEASSQEANIINDNNEP
ncbi:11054_t:CDS:2 [Ambispora leptoticha]|uniref:11054_t:CDS:1 n=1 Tax=Ambispora leptoticha TaxID=144679 RepID=A0A9N8W669_9GLOM|nr:11054_t:CDS:2 [Ambispora leptoticha]